jgi:hypothetical protein
MAAWAANRGWPDGATYAATKTGWFDMEKFNQWMKMVSEKF